MRERRRERGRAEQESKCTKRETEGERFGTTWREKEEIDRKKKRERWLEMERDVEVIKGGRERGYIK